MQGLPTEFIVNQNKFKKLKLWKIWNIFSLSLHMAEVLQNKIIYLFFNLLTTPW